MKRYPFYLFLIAALIIAAVVICGKPQIVPAIGQDKKTTTLIDPDQLTLQWLSTYQIYADDTIKVIFDGKEYETTYPVEMFMGLLAVYNELKLYSAECYADSTKVRMGYFWQFNGEIFKAIYKPKGGEMVHNLKEVRDEYIHREPIFTGFMEFLEKKYK